MNLTTVSKVAAYLGRDVSASEAALSALIASVSEAIEHYCGREFALLERTQILDGRGTSSLVLPCRPVTSVDDVRFDPSRIFGDDTIIPATSIVYYGDVGLLHWDGGVFPAGRQNVRVTYTAGYSAAPASVEQAANMLVAHFYHRGRQGGDGVSSESMGAYTVSYDEADWPASVKTLLNEFREVLV